MNRRASLLHFQINPHRNVLIGDLLLREWQWKDSTLTGLLSIVRTKIHLSAGLLFRAMKSQTITEWQDNNNAFFTPSTAHTHTEEAEISSKNLSH